MSLDRKHEVRLLVGGSRTARLAVARKSAAEENTRLRHIDLDRVVGKYIGETEKNLAALFDQAAAKGWILFFDEADALFGKRTEVKAAHDRYANLEVGYLLDRLAAYPGLVLLASNRADCLDPLVKRKLKVLGA
jgi:SpoVK/Ycf46/Vps4 family AAA+-type ATPase